LPALLGPIQTFPEQGDEDAACLLDVPENATVEVDFVEFIVTVHDHQLDGVELIAIGRQSHVILVLVRAVEDALRQSAPTLRHPPRNDRGLT
jgi:hypothetical protein